MSARLDGELAAAEAGLGRGQLRVEPRVRQPRGRGLRPPAPGLLLPLHLQEEGCQEHDTNDDVDDNDDDDVSMIMMMITMIMMMIMMMMMIILMMMMMEGGQDAG